MRSGTSPALTPVASLDTIWLSGMTVSAILSACPVFQRSVRRWAALAPLARTHMAKLSDASTGVETTAAPVNRTATNARRAGLLALMSPPSLLGRRAEFRCGACQPPTETQGKGFL